MLGTFVFAYIVFAFCINRWFRGEIQVVKDLVRKCAFKFLGIFILQAVFQFLQNGLNYYLIYKQTYSKVTHLWFQISFLVFPIFDLIIPTGFVLYTHYSNFKDDEKVIYSEYENHITATSDGLVDVTEEDFDDENLRATESEFHELRRQREQE